MVSLPKRRGGTDATAQGGSLEAQVGHSGGNQAGFPGPVSTASDFGPNQAGSTGPVMADSDFRQHKLSDLSRALALLQGVQEAPCVIFDYCLTRIS